MRLKDILRCIFSIFNKKWLRRTEIWFMTDIACSHLSHPANRICSTNLPPFFDHFKKFVVSKHFHPGMAGIYCEWHSLFPLAILTNIRTKLLLDANIFPYFARVSRFKNRGHLIFFITYGFTQQARVSHYTKERVAKSKH